MEIEISKETPPLVVVSQTQTERKPFHLNKWHVVTVILLAVIVAQGFLYLSTSSENQNLRNEYNTLQSDFNSLQSNYDSYVSGYNRLANQVNNRTLGTDGEHFVTPQDMAAQNLVLEITNGWSNRSDWNEFWDDVKIMYDWIVNNIKYRDDGLSPLLPITPSGNIEYRQEMWQLPNETLNLKQGDCEDMAILLTVMIRVYDGDTYRDECIEIAGSISGHMGVQMSVEGSSGESLLTILDPAGHYYTQTAYGNIDSEDISTEINNWLNNWKPSLGNDVHVQRVFSNHLDKSFSSTSEYTSWMYSR